MARWGLDEKPQRCGAWSGSPALCFLNALSGKDTLPLKSFCRRICISLECNPALGHTANKTARLNAGAGMVVTGLTRPGHWFHRSSTTSICSRNPCHNLTFILLSQRRKPRLSKDVKLFFKKTKRRAFISHGSEGRRSPRSRCWQIPKPPSCEEAQVGLVRSAGVPGPERPRPLPLPCILSSPLTEHATSVEGSRAHHCPTNAVLCRWESPQHGAWPRAGAR